MEKKDTLGTLSSVPLAIPRPMSFRTHVRNFLASESKGKNLFHPAECRRKSASLNLHVIPNACEESHTKAPCHSEP